MKARDQHAGLDPHHKTELGLCRDEHEISTVGCEDGCVDSARTMACEIDADGGCCGKRGIHRDARWIETRWGDYPLR